MVSIGRLKEVFSGQAQLKKIKRIGATPGKAIVSGRNHRKNIVGMIGIEHSLGTMETDYL